MHFFILKLLCPWSILATLLLLDLIGEATELSKDLFHSNHATLNHLFSKGKAISNEHL
jgi:hypothetical protein